MSNPKVRIQQSYASTVQRFFVAGMLLLLATTASAQGPWRVDFPVFRFSPTYWPMFGSSFEGRTLVGTEEELKCLSQQLGISLELAELSNRIDLDDRVDTTGSVDHTVISFGVDAYMWQRCSIGEWEIASPTTQFLGIHVSGNVIPKFIGEWRLRFGRVLYDRESWFGRVSGSFGLLDLEVRPGESPAAIRQRGRGDDPPTLETRFAGGVRVTWSRFRLDRLHVSPSLGAEARLRIPSTNMALIWGLELRAHDDRYDWSDLDHSLRLGARIGNSYEMPGITIAARYTSGDDGLTVPFWEPAGLFSLSIGIDY